MTDSPRTSLALVDDWRFLPDPDGVGEFKLWYKNGLPDEARSIRVPHTWNVDPETETFVGRGWYARTLDVPAAWAGKTVRIAFAAAYRDAVVWINGSRAADHYGSGYTPFDVDATPYLRPGEENLLVVAVDNGFDHAALPYLRHYDWANDGGLIRPVHLIVTDSPAIDAVHVKASPILAGPGVADGGRVDVRVELAGTPALDNPRIRLTITGPSTPRHSEPRPHHCHAERSEASVSDQRRRSSEPDASLPQHDNEEGVARNDGGEAVGVTEWEDERSVDVHDGAIVIDGIALPNIRLWHFDYPHLYTLRVAVLRDGEETDAVKTRFGFREIRVEGPRIVLNGEPVRLMGVEWMPGADPAVGMAEDDTRIDATLKAMKDANCVLTRFHWQQDERVLDWCDRHGMLVQEEVPLWGHPKEPGEATMAIARAQARVMIHRHANHPSIIAWGMGNELDGQSPVTRQTLTDFRAFIRALDDTRLVNYVSNTFHHDPARDATVAGDVLMWNGYAGTWIPELDLAEFLGRAQAELPDRPLVISEFGLCEPAHPGGDPRRVAMLREQMPPIGACPIVTGAIYFSFSDYRTHMGEEGEGRHRRRVHGVTDLVGRPKPSYAVLRELSAPIRIVETRRLSPTAVSVTVQANPPEAFPSFRLCGYRVVVGSDDNAAFANLPDIAPGACATVTIDDVAGADEEVQVYIARPDGGLVA